MNYKKLFEQNLKEWSSPLEKQVGDNQKQEAKRQSSIRAQKWIIQAINKLGPIVGQQGYSEQKLQYGDLVNAGLGDVYMQLRQQEINCQKKAKEFLSNEGISASEKMEIDDYRI